MRHWQQSWRQARSAIALLSSSRHHTVRCTHSLFSLAGVACWHRCLLLSSRPDADTCPLLARAAVAAVQREMAGVHEVTERCRAENSRLKAELDETRACLREAEDKERAASSLVNGIRRELASLREQHNDDQQRANREKAGLTQQVWAVSRVCERPPIVHGCGGCDNIALRLVTPRCAGIVLSLSRPVLVVSSSLLPCPMCGSDVRLWLPCCVRGAAPSGAGRCEGCEG